MPGGIVYPASAKGTRLLEERHLERADTLYASADSEVYSLAVSGSDVYGAGYSSNTSSVWVPWLLEKRCLERIAPPGCDKGLFSPIRFCIRKRRLCGRRMYEQRQCGCGRLLEKRCMERIAPLGRRTPLLGLFSIHSRSVTADSERGASRHVAPRSDHGQLVFGIWVMGDATANQPEGAPAPRSLPLLAPHSQEAFPAAGVLPPLFAFA